jgi:Ca-activated chloride channel family protein
MTVLWPEMLWLLLLAPMAVVLYVLVLRRKKKAAVRYASLSMVKAALGPGNRLRRHVPPLLFLVALVTMLAAISRPAAVVTLPSEHETVVLALDVSGSMRAKDVEPDRMTAAQNAAKAFINEQPRNAKIALVAFAGSASLVQPPTRNRGDLMAAIDRLQLQHATAVGSGILVSLKAIFPEQEFDLTPGMRQAMRRGGAPSTSAGAGATAPGHKPAPPKPVPPGSFTSAAIILLTDGQTTTGPDPVDAARLAAERGVRVFTVGVGTPDGQILAGEGWSMRVRLDEETLKSIADLTRAEYFHAGNAPDLKKIYQALNAKLVMEKKETEVTALFAAAAAGLMLLAGLLSLLWFNRIL